MKNVMTPETLLVVHDSDLYKQFAHRHTLRCQVVKPCTGLIGQRYKAVVFVDGPTAEQCASELWLESYRHWVDESVRTRLTPGANIFGLSAWAQK
ncbi:hypothetical protein [Xanthomonas phage MYK3]|nr:hypothetical protein [Xanthomonas phage MYK3]